MVFKIEKLIKRAEELMHRNTKQKDELIVDIITYLEKNKKNNFIVDLNKISFEYVQFYKGFHPLKRHDEEWKKGKVALIRFLEGL